MNSVNCNIGTICGQDSYKTASHVQGTQTSKTILELAMLETKNNSKPKDTYFATINNSKLEQPNSNTATQYNICTLPRLSRFTIKEIRVKSVEKSRCMSKDDGDTSNTTISSNEELVSSTQTVRSTVSSARRARSVSPCTQPSNIAQFTDRSSTCDILSEVTPQEYLRPERDTFYILISHVKSRDWIISMKALVQLSDILHTIDRSILVEHMPMINQRLLEFLRSPRSHVCRTGCQVAGRLFSEVKDTRRPEFDTIVELLLTKTADANRFIRQDAGVALQILIREVSPFHTIRAISQKSPNHKSDLVRISCAKLFFYIIEYYGVGLVLNPSSSEFIRKRIFTHMIKFIKDKNYKTREYGARLYVELQSHPNFDYYLKQIIDKSNIMEIRNILKDKLYIK